ncbi:MAG TPA: tRNA (uridine(34)/cytosine(34)/5-carboxymethylaminomethyluridine(34)-2'-O)-methyltransferase TrmL, partial [Ruminiclostridium sp.]|nr:tRNA (uridine(34)/cytosine(34)/5-carboxymethylaminomethyluridine(34)-2'-O)-methyltransferase TrmL [Ruminiclostridium sp.]
IVLVEPEIPQNTGNIARTCAATGAILHLIEPLGFSVSDKYLKRAGLDYWHMVQIHFYKSFDLLKSKFSGVPFYFVSTKAKYVYSDIVYPDECFFVFGKETAGLPENLLKENYEHCIRIPMLESIRSLNLSNSVAIVVYEFFRQKGFADLQKSGFIQNGN